MSDADDSEEDFLKQLMAMDLADLKTEVLSQIKDDEELPDAIRRGAAQLMASGSKEEVLAWVLEWAKKREGDWRRAERLSDALLEIRAMRDATLQDES
eukprot:scaffold38645_cov57-Phaeocystis_antarctica.AAC.1